MHIALHRNDDSIRIRVEGDLDLASAYKLRDALLEAFRADGACSLDLTAAGDLDFACLQLVVAAQKSFGADGRVLTIEEHERVQFTSAALDAGFPAAFGAAS